MTMPDFPKEMPCLPPTTATPDARIPFVPGAYDRTRNENELPERTDAELARLRKQVEALQARVVRLSAALAVVVVVLGAVAIRLALR